MDSKGKFWFYLWGSVLLAITIIVLSSFMYLNFEHQSKRDAIVSAVSKGGDPVRTACALEILEDSYANVSKIYCATMNKD